MCFFPKKLRWRSWKMNRNPRMEVRRMGHKMTRKMVKHQLVLLKIERKSETNLRIWILKKMNSSLFRIEVMRRVRSWDCSLLSPFVRASLWPPEAPKKSGFSMFVVPKRQRLELFFWRPAWQILVDTRFPINSPKICQISSWPQTSTFAKEIGFDCQPDRQDFGDDATSRDPDPIFVGALEGRKICTKIKLCYPTKKHLLNPGCLDQMTSTCKASSWWDNHRAQVLQRSWRKIRSWVGRWRKISGAAANSDGKRLSISWWSLDASDWLGPKHAFLYPVCFWSSTQMYTSWMGHQHQQLLHADDLRVRVIGFKNYSFCAGEKVNVLSMSRMENALNHGFSSAHSNGCVTHRYPTFHNVARWGRQQSSQHAVGFFRPWNCEYIFSWASWLNFVIKNCDQLWPIVTIWTFDVCL